MILLLIFVILIGIAVIGMSIASGIVYLVNQISGSLDDTKYKENTKANCDDNIKNINSAQTLLTIIRVLAIIVISICVILLLIVIVAIIISARAGTIMNEVGGGGGFITNLFSNRLFYVMVLGSLTFIFLAFAVGYAVLLGLLNNVVVEGCIDGPESVPEGQTPTPLMQFAYAKNMIIIQMVVCLIMFVVTLSMLIVLLISSAKGKGVKGLVQNLQKSKKNLDSSELKENLKTTAKDTGTKFIDKNKETFNALKDRVLNKNQGEKLINKEVELP